MWSHLFKRITTHPLVTLVLTGVVVAASSLVASRVDVDYSVEQFFPTWGEERAVFDEYRAIFPGEDAQVAFFLSTPAGLDKTSWVVLERVASAFEQSGLERVQWMGSEIPDAAGDLAVLKSVAGSPVDHPLFRGTLVNADGTVHVVQGWLPPSMNGDTGRRSFVAGLTEILDGLDIPTRWALSGTPVIRAQVPELLEVDQKVLLGGGVVLFFLVLFLFFRRARLAVMALATVAPAYVVTLGAMVVLERPITILTSFIPIVILVVGVCDTTHVLEHWSRARARGVGRRRAVQQTFERIALSCFFTSVTTAIGFASLWATGIDVVADFGLFTALAVLSTFGFTVTVLPALLTTVRHAPARVSRPGLRLTEGAGLTGTVVRGARATLAGGSRWLIPTFALVAVSAVALASTLRIDTYLVDDLKDETAIKKDLRWIQDAGFGLFQTNLFVRADSEVLTRPEMMEWMARFEESVATESLVLGTYGPPDFLLASVPDNVPNGIPDWLLRPELDAAQMVITVEDAGSRATLAFLDRMDDQLQRDPPPFGSARITGTVRMAHTFSFHVLRSFGPSILLALGLILLVMVLLFRSWRLGLVAMVPNLFPLVVLAGVMALLRVPLKPSTILVFSIAFGIAVDDSIHLMSAFTHGLSRDLPPRRALRAAIRETGPALVMSTFVVSAGFSLLLFSRFELLYLLGLLTAVTAVAALAADLLLFPAIIERMGSVRAPRDGTLGSRLSPVAEDPVRMGCDAAQPQWSGRSVVPRTLGET
jgi:predicted RND superfamily exporter protein